MNRRRSLKLTHKRLDGKAEPYRTVLRQSRKMTPAPDTGT